MACILLWRSTVKDYGSQLHRKMDVTWERISRILELREIPLSIQTGVSLVNAAVACAILESISGLEPSSAPTHAHTLTRIHIRTDRQTHARTHSCTHAHMQH